jgi:hypothetical protein
MDRLTEDLDPIRRLRVLSAALPGVTHVERLIDAPFHAVWAIAGDLEGGLPRFEPGIVRVEILARDDDRLSIVVHTARGPSWSWNVLLRPGLCWMQSSRGLLVGLAAVAEPDGRTRFAHAEGTRRAAGRLLAPVLRRKVRKEILTIERLAREDVAAQR